MSTALLAVVVAFLVGVVTYFMWPRPKPKKVTKAVQTTPVKKPAPAAPAKQPVSQTIAKPKETEPIRSIQEEPVCDPEMEEKKEEEVVPEPTNEEQLHLGPYNGVVISHIVGPHGSTLKSIAEQSGSKVNVNDENIVVVVGGDTAKAKMLVEKIVEEQAHPDYEGKKGHALRQRADSMRRDSKTSYAEAQAAFDAGDKGKGHELLAKVKELNAKSKDTDLKAAQAIFQHRNKTHDGLKFDLHGLHVQEALDLFAEELEQLQEEEKSGRVVEVIPGAGHHSKGGEGHAKLKPAVLKFLKEKNLETHEHNAGSVFVNLDGLDTEAFNAKCEELS